MVPKWAWSGSRDQICNFTSLVFAARKDRAFIFYTELRTEE